MEYLKILSSRRIRIPMDLAAKYDLKVGDYVAIKDFKDKCMIVYPAKPPQIKDTEIIA